MLNIAYAMGNNPATQGTQNPLGIILPFIIIFAIFYFLLIRPQKIQQKKHKETIGSVTKNDKIITSGGIHGVVIRVKEKTVILRVDDNAKLEIQKSAIAHVEKK